MRWLPDVNIWLALCVPDHVQYQVALQWINENEQPIFSAVHRSKACCNF